ncbi:MAG: CDP-diacylglycerol--glycerol-3-phosphate 3-phosphatidyltransferase [Clostridiales bacterium]|nr:CDP-diacylglycerol--glycerol-3-phosphate 3-phosphatidyltransferase [Clostridiales bacterium]
MNLPNKITISRILLIPIFMIVLYLPIPYREIIALAIFIIAAATDGIDGHIARSRNLVTNFGKFLDPLADKLLVTAALVALVGMQRIPSWIVTVIIAREFAVTGIRLLAVGEGRVIAASMLGKIKTVTQIIAISLLLIDTYTLSGQDVFMVEKIKTVITGLIQTPSLMGVISILSTLMVIVATFTTLYSCYDYIVKNVDVLKSNK